jgi:Fur family ferric uptake transcriptional regulator
MKRRARRPATPGHGDHAPPGKSRRRAHADRSPQDAGSRSGEQRRATPSRRTAQQAAIVAAIAQTGRPLSPAELLAIARRTVPSLGQATVYRAISRLVERGELATVNLPGQPPRYEPASPSEAHHRHHFQCDDCGRVFSLDGCPGNLERLAPPGFDVLRHELTLFGRCGCERLGGRRS